MASIGFNRLPAGAAQFELKCATDLPVSHPLNIRLTEMWAKVEEESGGLVRTQLFPNSQLGGDAAMFQQVRSGALTFFVAAPGTVASVIPTFEITNLGFAFKDEDEALRAADGPLGDFVRAQAATVNLHVMRSVWNSGMYQTASSLRLVRNPDELRGLKVRVVDSRITVDLFKAMGASPVPLVIAETYQALQTKLVDGAAVPLLTIESLHFYELCNFISLTNHQWSGVWMVANGDAWKAMPADIQAIIERNNTKYAGLERTDSKAINASLAEKMRGRGVQVARVEQAPFRAKLGPYYEYWAGVFGPDAMSALAKSTGRSLS